MSRVGALVGHALGGVLGLALTTAMLVVTSALASCTPAHAAPLRAPANDDGTCAPAPVADARASSWIAPRAPESACSDDDITSYFHACLDPASAIPIACQQFVSNHAACSSCILDPDAHAAATSALLQRPGSVAPNVGGCIALILDDDSATGCGAREQAAIDCDASSCADCSDASCRYRATQSTCADAQLRRCGELAGAAVCVPRGSPVDDFRRVARTFCTAHAG